MNKQIKLPQTNLSAPAFGFYDDSNTGFYQTSAGEIKFITGRADPKECYE